MAVSYCNNDRGRGGGGGGLILRVMASELVH